VAFIPNAITLCNAVCGFIALTLIAGSLEGGTSDPLERLERAAWFILAGMLFDVFDGKVARVTGGGTTLGAQLDSLADLVSFGLAPAGLALAMFHHSGSEDFVSPLGKMMWVFSLAYFLGALLRLARFNSIKAEKDDPDEAEAFVGLPTPGAAGVVAGLVICFFWLREWQSWDLRLLAAEKPAWVELVNQGITSYLPVTCFVLGYLMVSQRIRYTHMGTVLMRRGMNFDRFTSFVFGTTLIVFFAEPVILLAFAVYGISPVLAFLWRPFSRRPAVEEKSESPSPDRDPETE
jgi:CDP-diacylglycerol--serine O-phosphatidyltransferase